MKIIIFGTGSYVERLIKILNKDVEIVAVSDNDSTKWGTIWHNIAVVPPEKLDEYNFEYILIASMYREKIKEQLLDMGLSKDRVKGCFFTLEGKGKKNLF